jgi:hypothetical protein
MDPCRAERFIEPKEVIWEEKERMVSPRRPLLMKRIASGVNITAHATTSPTRISLDILRSPDLRVAILG